jgi:hypothetical protein
MGRSVAEMADLPREKMWLDEEEEAMLLQRQRRRWRFGERSTNNTFSFF